MDSDDSGSYSDTDDSDSETESVDINMVWNNTHNINFKDTKVEVVEKTDYLLIESQDRLNYQFDETSHPSDIHVVFGTVSNREDDKTTIHSLIGKSSHIEKVYKNVKSIELVSVTIPKIYNIITSNLLINNTDIYIVTLRDFYNACESNSEIFNSSFGILRPVDRKTIQPIIISNNEDKNHQGYIDLIPANKCIRVFDNPVSTINNLNIILKDSFNKLIYQDYTDFRPIDYLKINSKMEIYFKEELKKNSNCVSDFVKGDMINVTSKLNDNQNFAESILNNGMLLCFKRFVEEGVYIKKEVITTMTTMTNQNNYVSDIKDMIDDPVQLKGYFSNNKSRVEDFGTKNISIDLPSYLSSKTQPSRYALTQNISYKLNGSGDTIIEFTFNTNVATTITNSIHLKAFDICLFVFEHCYYNSGNYELLYHHQSQDVKVDNDTIVKGNYYQLKLNTNNNKPTDNSGVLLNGVFIFPSLGSFDDEFKKGSNNIETNMRTAIANMSQKTSANDLKTMLNFSNGLAIKKQPIINVNNRGLPFTKTSSSDSILKTLFNSDPPNSTPNSTPKNISWPQLYSNYITQFVNKLYVINNSRKYFYNFKINYLEPKNPNLTFNSK